MTRGPRFRLLLFVLLLPFILAARTRPIDNPSSAATRDVFSFAEPQKITTRHISLDLDVDFATRRLSGTATLQIENLSGARALVLDTDGLEISSISVDGVPANYNLGAASFFGQPLTITVTPTSREVRIAYTTRPEATGLHWNSAAQSFGRVAPYLYSQNEPTYARSWIPLQDTPRVRVTYDARIHVPLGMLALMSAENPTETNDSGVYTFRMQQPISSYLIALAVGRLSFHAFDERTGVYAEPELLEDAAYELQFIPTMVDTAERLLTPYPWERYDVLLMPPTYTVGGMEHPRLNFISPLSVVTQNHPPTIDPSPLIAHELSHAWAGDLVTLTTWQDVWLNEGITSYLTLRVLEEMSGVERTELGFYLDRSNYESYAASVQDPTRTVLHHQFTPQEPPIAAFDSTAYTKGELFLKTLEDRIGRSELDRFLRQYFTTFAFTNVTDRTFLSFLRQEALAGRNGLEPSLLLEQWVYGVGVPANITAPTTSRTADRILGEAQAFAAGRKASELPLKSWTRYEHDLFLQVARRDVELRMGELDAAFGFSLQRTPPLQWLLAAARTEYQPARAALERVLARGGPNSWIQQLYSALSRTPNGLTYARSLFDRYRDRYEEGVQAYLERILGSARSKRAA